MGARGFVSRPVEPLLLTEMDMTRATLLVIRPPRDSADGVRTVLGHRFVGKRLEGAGGRLTDGASMVRTNASCELRSSSTLDRIA